MTRDLILGTAGHIDHGKTALVKALTGIDCDRLPEEKARGITIDVGFAHLDLGTFHLGIVDVPGHERFIRNMLAGVTGIDLALLVVSAKESVKPQTREHLDILSLLGLRRGVIALTMCDLADEITREVVEAEVRDLVRGTFLEAAPIVHTSAHTGLGLDELKQALLANAECGMRDAELSEVPHSGDFFRMAIDRAFVVQGHGTVVTGSVTSGRLRAGDEVEWLPRGERVRVRSLQSHDRPAGEVCRGMRAALNLAGVRHEEVARGQEVATPGFLVPARVLTARLHCLSGGPRPIKHRAEVRLHVGTLEAMATVALLDCDSVAPGQWALAQFFVEEPVVAVWGQPFVVRSSSGEETLGGGQVLQPSARKVRRRHVEVLERIEKLSAGDPEERALTVAWFAGVAGVSEVEMVRGAGVSPEQAAALLARLRDRERLVEADVGHGRPLVLHADVLRDLEARVLGVIDRLHEAFPLVASHDRSKVQTQLDYVGDDALLQAAVDQLLARKELIGDGRRLARAAFKPKLSHNQTKLKNRIVAAYRDASFQPPEPDDFINQAGGNASSLDDLMQVCVAEGHLIQISGTLYLHAAAETQMRRRLADKLTGGRGLTVAEIRDLLGTTRKYAVPLCEYLDRVGVTRREGDLRFAGGAPPGPNPR